VETAVEATCSRSLAASSAIGKAKTATASREAASTTKGTALAHHGEDDLGVNAATHAATAEHIRRVHEVLAMVVPSTLPTFGVSHEQQT
jgi:hypothetical protein